MARRPKPLVIAALGGRGSGKSAWVKQLLQRSAPPRLIAWDFMREYQLPKQLDNLGDTIRAMRDPTWSIAYRPNPSRAEAEFDLVCRAVKAARKCVLVAEELAFVTKPNKAPDAWRELCLLGRHETHAESTIVGVSQRPASIDKDFLACCDVIHCGRLAYPPDAQAVAPYLGCDWRELTQLGDLHFIERRAGETELTRGVLSFGNDSKKTSKPKRATNGASS